MLETKQFGGQNKPKIKAWCLKKNIMKFCTNSVLWNVPFEDQFHELSKITCSKFSHIGNKFSVFSGVMGCFEIF